MPAKPQSFKFTRAINAPPAQVYRAFTNSSTLREWFSDSAQADPRKGGRLYLWWNSGYYAAGEYTAAEADKKAAFTWQGRGEPAPSRVAVAIKPKGEGAVVTITHTVAGGAKWARTIKALQKGWETGLENLQSVLETGEDLRFTLRPMLGITLNDFSPEIAKRLGVPVSDGVRLDGTLEGMGAYAAGLRQNDVIVGLAGKKVTGQALAPALQGKRAGDKVPVVFYRGAEKMTVTMELSRRPLPAIPPAPAELAAAVRRQQVEVDGELERLLEGVSEAEAEFRAGGEWSVKQHLAHLIGSERFTHTFIADLVTGHEIWYDGVGTNVDAQLTGWIAAYPTVRELVDELKRSECASASMIEALPAEMVARKSAYWRLGHNLLQPAYHTREHFELMRAAVAAARRR